MRTLITILFTIQVLISIAGTRYYRASFRDDPSTTIYLKLGNLLVYFASIQD